MAFRRGRSSAPGPPPLSKGAEGPHGRRTRRSSRLLDSDQGSNDSSSANRDSDQAPEKMLVKEELPLPVDEVEDVQIEDKLEPKRKQRKETNNKEENELDGKKEEKEKSRPRRQTPKSNPRCNLACCLSKIPNSEDKMSSRSGYSSAPGTPPLSKGADGTHSMRTRRSSRLSDSDHGPNDSSSSNRDSNQAPEMMLVKEELPLPIDELEVIGLREDQEPPEKKRSIQCEPEVPNIVAEEKPDECVSTEEGKDLDEELLENDEKYKSCEEPVAESSESNTPTLESPALPLSILASLSEALLSLGQDESHSIKSESDRTIEVDSQAEGSQEGLCESESAGGLEASTTSSSLQCNTIIQEKDLKGGAAQSSETEDLPTLDHKCSPMEHPNTSESQTLTTSPARGTSPPMKDVAKDEHKEKTQTAPAKTYTWSFPPEILDNMTGEERIVFIEDKMEEMIQRYRSLQSELVSIDQEKKQFKKKGRKVTLPGAAAFKCSASSEAVRSPPASLPP